MKQTGCILSNCPDFIPPARAGFRGLSGGEPGVMSKNGRCAVTGRIIERMKSCPKEASRDK